MMASEHDGPSCQGESYIGSGGHGTYANGSGGGGGVHSGALSGGGGGGGGGAVGAPGALPHDWAPIPNGCLGGAGGLLTEGRAAMAHGLIPGAGGGAGALSAEFGPPHGQLVSGDVPAAPLRVIRCEQLLRPQQCRVEGKAPCVGGNGGGIIEIVASAVVIKEGAEIRTSGTDGGSGLCTDSEPNLAQHASLIGSSGGGGGSGGALLIRTNELTCDGALRCGGGSGGAAGKTRPPHTGSAGGRGGGGRIRLDVDFFPGEERLRLVSAGQHVALTRQPAPESIKVPQKLQAVREAMDRRDPAGALLDLRSTMYFAFPDATTAPPKKKEEKWGEKEKSGTCVLPLGPCSPHADWCWQSDVEPDSCTSGLTAALADFGAPDDVPETFRPTIVAGHAVLQQIVAEDAMAAQLRHVVDRSASMHDIRSALHEVNTSLDDAEDVSDQPGAIGTGLYAAMVAAEAAVDGQTAAVEAMLCQRLGHDVVAEHLCHLSADEYEGLVPICAVSARLLSRCTCGGRLHDAPQQVLAEIREVAEALQSAASHAAGVIARQTDKVGALARRLPVLKVEVDALRQAKEEAEQQLMAAIAASETAHAAHTDLEARARAHDAQLGAERDIAVELAARNVHLDALCRHATERQAAHETWWRKWQNKIGVVDALSEFDDDDVEPLLVILGRCSWIGAFAQQGVAASMLKQLTEAELLLVVNGAPQSCFGDARSFILAIQHIDAGRGLPSTALEAQADIPDADMYPIEHWSVDAVAAHFDGLDLQAAAEQCRTHGISGEVLLSMDRNDVFSQLRFADGIAGHRAFEAAIAELQATGAAAAAAVVGKASAPSQLSAAMIRVLVSDGEPTEFPLDYVRRCTHGFSESHLEGAGSFGSVYRGVDPVAGIRFAVKRVSDHAHASPQQREAAERSLRQELTVLRSARHPHMIRLIGYCTPAGGSAELCLLYELGVHGSVADNLINDAKAAAFGWKDRARALAALASVLNFMHRSHSPPIFHRDVKSANLVLDQAMSIKLIDCGIAKLLSDDQVDAQGGGKSLFTMGASAGGILGTPGYMCPKYTSGGRYGEKSETFAFGVVVLELLTGRLTASFDDGLFNHYMNAEEKEAEMTLDALDPRAGRWPIELGSALIEVAGRCVGAFKRRPTMQGVLGALRPLERQHCELTVDEVQRRAAIVHEQNQALVQATQDGLRAQHRAEQKAERDRQALAHERAEEAQDKAEEAEQARLAALRTCCICYDELDLSQGVECTAPTAGDAQFTCDACFGEHVTTESEKPLHELDERQARVFCPLTRHGCPCATPYAESTVAVHVTPAVFGMYLAAKERTQEQKLVQELETHFEERLEAERLRLSEMRSDELQIERMRCHVIDRILTLKCPRCEAAFLDFNGCFALTCHRCRCGFCAYCLHDCGRDAHNHVGSCPSNRTGDIYGSFEIFERAQRDRRERMALEYLGTLDAALRVQVIDSCAQEFSDLGIALHRAAD